MLCIKCPGKNLIWTAVSDSRLILHAAGPVRHVDVDQHHHQQGGQLPRQPRASRSQTWPQSRQSMEQTPLHRRDRQQRQVRDNHTEFASNSDTLSASHYDTLSPLAASLHTRSLTTLCPTLQPPPDPALRTVTSIFQFWAIFMPSVWSANWWDYSAWPPVFQEVYEGPELVSWSHQTLSPPLRHQDQTLFVRGSSVIFRCLLIWASS